MKLLLGSLLFAGVCWLGAAIDFTAMPNFHTQPAAGDWHPLAHIVLEKRFPSYTVQAGSGGTMFYSVRYPAGGTCNTKTVQFTEQGHAGKYTEISQTNVQILDTDYQSYIISYVEQGMGAYLTLAGKQRTMSAALKTKFKQFATTAGVTGAVVPVVLAASC